MRRSGAQLTAGFGPIDYVALVDAATLEPLDEAGGEMRLIAAAMIGQTRLIDNMRVDFGHSSEQGNCGVNHLFVVDARNLSLNEEQGT